MFLEGKFSMYSPGKLNGEALCSINAYLSIIWNAVHPNGIKTKGQY